MENQLLLTFFCDSFYPLFLAANTQATVLLSLTMIILLILSFFISGAEVAFFSLTYRDINLLKTKQDPGWKRIVNLLEEPKLLAATLQISNTFVNIAIIILANVLIDQIRIAEADTWWMTLMVIGVKVIVITSVLILFGEALPKVRASQNNLRFAYEASYLVEVLYYLFKRTAARLISMSDYIERFLGGKGVARLFAATVGSRHQIDRSRRG